MNKLFKLSASDLARLLIGSVLSKIEPDGKILSGIIVETEAYLAKDDLASHSATGKTKRNAIMFGEGGYLYVYKIYGIHHCINIVSGENKSGEAVLIRAIEPLNGIETMIERRGTDKVHMLCKGPGNVAKAFGFTLADNGKMIGGDELTIQFNKITDEENILKSTRIGINKSKDLELRFYLKNSRFVSGKNYNQKVNND